MSECTPTVAEVREYVETGGEYAPWVPPNREVEARRGEAFDRMIAEVERAAAEKALSKAADDLRVNFSRGAAIAMHHECHKKQCRCGNPGNDEIVREVFEAAREAIRNEALPYRRNEGEKE